MTNKYESFPCLTRESLALQLNGFSGQSPKMTLFELIGQPLEEAKTVFYDPNAKLIADPDHSEEEDRFIILGISNNSEVLAVCHCYRENDEVIRIISARKATTNEKKQYGEN